MSSVSRRGDLVWLNFNLQAGARANGAQAGVRACAGSLQREDGPFFSSVIEEGLALVLPLLGEET